MSINTNKNFSRSLPLEIQNILADLENHKSTLTPNRFEKACATINGLGLVSTNVHAIAKLTSEKERNTAVTYLTGLLAEPGFSEGRNEEEVSKFLTGRVNLLLQNYQLASDQNQLQDFFLNAFKGDPCFNGRVGKLEEWGAKSRFNLQEESLQNTGYSTQLANKYLELLYEMSEKQPNAVLTMDNFIGFMRQLPNYQSEHQQFVGSSQFPTIWTNVKLAFGS